MGTQKYRKMPNRHMEMYSISLVIKQLYIKTTMKYDFTPTRMAKLKEMSNTKNCQI